MNGTGVSPGISIGRAYLFKKEKAIISGIEVKDRIAKMAEIEKFNRAVSLAIDEVERIKTNTSQNHRSEEIDILDTQIEFLGDPQIRSDVQEKINGDGNTAFDAVILVIDAAVQLFRDIDDEYLSARATDIQDIGNRLIKFLNPSEQSVSRKFPENTILIAEDIAPSDTITLDITRVIGFATQSGGKTSHTAIIARAKGIPAVVGCGSELSVIKNDDILIVDGSSGVVIVRPDLDTIELYKAKQKIHFQEQAILKLIKDLPTQTSDGHRVNLYGNISNANDLVQVFENGGEGVGLVRTEMLFIGRNSLPSEEEQFNFYREVALKSKTRPVIIRTLDIGGDKQLSYFGIPPENNPFLGYRAIRICLDQREIFYTQLRAILRASIYGKLKIMFPMICNLSEVQQAKECVTKVKQELISSGIQFDSSVELGIMIEIPSAALMADILAKEVDFFSIGSNDLCQYTLAVDRMNDKVSGLYTHFNPGVLRLISNVIEQAHKLNKPVGLCGEMASDPLATLLLMGMGLEEFSMNARSIPVIKDIILKSSFTKAREVFETVMKMDKSESIYAYLQEVTR